MKLVSGLLATAVAGMVFGAVPVAAAPGDNCTRAGDVYRQDVPWAQRLLAPDQVWPLTRGAGQRVAVIGTGVDATNAQLAGRVATGTDVTTTRRGAANSDCAGWGTVAAGIVAAAPDLAHTTFAGIAPDAVIVPVRDAASVSSQNPPDPDLVAKAIDAARQARATVICVPVPAATGSGALATAVRNAVAAGAVVVSGVQATTAGTGPAVTSYPTSDAGVLGVGAVNASGASVSTEGGDYVGVSAPGADLVSTAPVPSGGEGQVAKVNLPGLAAAFVAGVVALVRAYHPDLTPAEVVARLERTADRPPSGGHDPRLGWGTVDLTAAVSAAVPDGTAAPGSATAQPIPAVRAATPAGHSGRLLPALLALGGVVLAALLTLAAATLRRARARHFQPGRRTLI